MSASIWFYCAGLACFTLCSMAYRFQSAGSTSGRKRLACKWLVGALALLGFSEWSDLLIAFAAAGRLNLVPLLLVALSAGCFTEAGLAVRQIRKLSHCRWLYAVVLIGVIAACLGRRVEADYVVRFCLGLAVTFTGIVAYRSFRMVDAADRRPRSSGDAAVLAGIAAAGGVFLLANLFGYHGIRGTALTVAAVLTMVAEFRHQPSGQSSFTWRRLALPTVFATLLVAGWAVAAYAPSVEHPNTAVVEVLVEQDEESGGEPASQSPKWLNAATLAITPPAVLVAVVWLLSRLQPTARRPAARA